MYSTSHPVQPASRSRDASRKLFVPTLIAQTLPVTINSPGKSFTINSSTINSPNLYSQLPRPAKELYYGDNATPGYDLIVQQCGGNISSLSKHAFIKQLLPICDTYKDICEYVRNSSDGKQIDVQSIYKIERFGDQLGKINESFRILLWHGTSPSAVPGIIETGFRKGKAGMFGGGIYFADRIAKSMTYSTKSKAGSTFFVLAEVYPGNMYKAHHFHTNYKASPKGFDSVKGMGSDIPNWKDNKDYFGAIMPCGETCRNRRHPSYDMKYNEYILYDMDRVLIRFIVECTF